MRDLAYVPSQWSWPQRPETQMGCKCTRMERMGPMDNNEQSERFLGHNRGLAANLAGCPASANGRKSEESAEDSDLSGVELFMMGTEEQTAKLCGVAGPWQFDRFIQQF